MLTRLTRLSRVLALCVTLGLLVLPAPAPAAAVSAASVSQRATLAISTKVVVGTPIRAVGTFRPISKGRPVQLQVFRTVAGRSSWRTVSIRREDSRGRVTFRLPTSRPGLFKYRLLAPAHRRLRAIATTARWVRVAPLPGSGTLVPLRVGNVVPNAPVVEADLSADGRYVAMLTTATNLTPGETDDDLDVFWAEPGSGTVRKVSRAYAPGGVHGDAQDLDISDDGLKVVYSTMAKDIAPGDINDTSDVYLHDVAASSTIRLSNSVVTRTAANGGSVAPDISGDGSTVVFTSTATDLIPRSRPSRSQVYVADLGAAQVSLLTTTFAGGESVGPAGRPSLSRDGRHVALISNASDLVPGMGETPGYDVFWFDRATGNRVWVTRESTARMVQSPVISPDGTRVAFLGRVGPAGPTEVADVLHWRVGSGRVVRASRSASGAGGNHSSTAPIFTPDSRELRFHSMATNLVAVPAGSPRVFGADLTTGRVWLASRRLHGLAFDGQASVWSVVRGGPTLLTLDKAVDGAWGPRLVLFHPCSTAFPC